MNLLLDTHTLLWLMEANPSLTPGQRRSLQTRQTGCI